ncbi:inverse autotransporter beta domain-containing protein [Providencia rettgeri]|uniref:inverse autotransporter beta domain-containing protein n=1 Tax=Providencia rettgeri TaxID=587 RepID=UPI0023612E47|nr:inverse autotransporter beta domain-containing protein [Providencia rettgeri]EMB5787495.1 inverse autotransporter beta domain-containing protein [Providencia rettgeri]MDK7746071.1 inverse autotransporter beta domain-containing protein [Providencia rettgeri]MDK7758517.1 inverse autotransporter beta domain-containing protein [Providencia rettgeri]
MNLPSSKLKPKQPNRLVLSTAIWSVAIAQIMPSYAKMLSTDDLPTLGSSATQFEGTQPEDSTEHFLAEYGQNAANFASKENKTKNLTDMAQDYARHKAANIATDEITHWLSKAGNARLNINLDKKLSIKTSQLDWLVPWYDQPDLLLFSQHSIHRTDGRLQTNNGLGLRHFQQNSMVGVNAFFDHDLSHYHSRLGFGVEYAQDYVRMSANSYLGLSTWRSASELAYEYNARPANGWDIQFEGWLPTYANLGANLKLEQYYGDDVALFGQNERQKNPMATTFGVNWSPFPLLALNAEHKMGSSGANETSAKVAFNWLLGKSLAQHLDASAVEATRHIASNRYDFVNRNNNIVLEYQKKTLISLSLPKVIQGITGEELSIIRNLSTKYPLDKIVIEAPELIAAGGEIHLNGLESSVKLPSYKIASNTVKNPQLNLYRLTVTAYDTNGNVSPQAETLIEVTNTGTLTISHANTAKRNNAVADGKDTNTFAVVIKDALGHPVPNAKVNFTLPTSLKSSDQKNTGYYSLLNHFMWKAQAAKSVPEQSHSIIANSKGEASIQFTSLVSGSYAIKANIDHGTEINEMYNFKSDISQSFIGSIDIIQNNAVADGSSKNTIKLHIVNNNRQSIAGAQVHFAALNGIISTVNLTDEYGYTELKVSSLVEGSMDVIATLNGDSRTIQVNFLRNGSAINIQPSTGTLFKSPINEQNRPTRTPLSLLRQLFQKMG